jgi:SAM-dependent methyltransferase
MAARQEDPQHWEDVYGRKAADDVSWYRPHLDRSLSFVDAAHLDPATAAIIDVGAGASTFADDLISKGFRDITLLDISSRALAVTKERLGSRQDGLTWLVGDATAIDLPNARYDFWHDRAVFHFLVDASARHRYVASAEKAVKSDGHVLVGTFGPDGPTKCSGLEVCRYTPEELSASFGAAFELVGQDIEVHTTPWGSPQSFVYALLRHR